MCVVSRHESHRGKLTSFPKTIRKCCIPKELTNTLKWVFYNHFIIIILIIIIITDVFISIHQLKDGTCFYTNSVTWLFFWINKNQRSRKNLSKLSFQCTWLLPLVSLLESGLDSDVWPKQATCKHHFLVMSERFWLNGFHHSWQRKNKKSHQKVQHNKIPMQWSSNESRNM